MGSGREVEVVFTTQAGTPDEVRKRVEKEATYAAAGIAPPPGVAPAGPPAAGGSKEIPRPASPPAPEGGLKGFWSRMHRPLGGLARSAGRLGGGLTPPALSHQRPTSTATSTTTAPRM